MSDAYQPRATRLQTRDIATVNAASHPGWRDQTYLLRPGPFDFGSLRLQLDDRLRAWRWSFKGAARTFAHLAEGALYIAFPRGRSVRVDGLPVGEDAAREVVTVASGGADYSGSTLERVDCDELLMDASALGDERLLARWRGRCGGRMMVITADTSARSVRRLLGEVLDAGDGGADRRAELVEAVQTMLEALVEAPDLLEKRPGARRHALARDAERLIWRRVAAPEPSGLSLDELCAALGTTRRTLQLAFQDHFGTPVGLVTRSVRLQRVRAELGSGAAPAVSDAALLCGFEHLGRFARYYRDFFGEPPSATLRARAAR